MLEVQKSIGNVSIRVSGESSLEVFKLLAQAHSVFGNIVCGLCGSSDTAPTVRRVKLDSREFDVYEIRCLKPDCGGVLKLGLYSDGSGLFSRQYVELADGSRDYSTRGWQKWQREKPPNVLTRCMEEVESRMEEPGVTEEENPFVEPEPKPTTQQEGKSKERYIRARIVDIASTRGEAPYPWELEVFNLNTKTQESYPCYIGGKLPVKPDDTVKLVITTSLTGYEYIKAIFPDSPAATPKKPAF